MELKQHNINGVWKNLWHIFIENENINDITVR